MLVTEFSKYGTLDEFLPSRYCKESKIPQYVIQTISLYKKNGTEFDFCNDTKPENMIITDALEIKIIDFDSDFVHLKKQNTMPISYSNPLKQSQNVFFQRVMTLS